MDDSSRATGAEGKLRRDSGIHLNGRVLLSYGDRDEVQEAHESHTEFYNKKVASGQISFPDDELLSRIEAQGPLLLTHPRVLAMFKHLANETPTDATIKTIASAAGVLSLTINKHVEKMVTEAPFVTGQARNPPMNCKRANKNRLRAGMLIGVWKLERLLDINNIEFPDFEFVSTPTGGALNKFYLCVVRFITEDYISCYVLTSKKQQGFKKVPKSERLNYIPIFPEGADYELPDGATTALFMTGRKGYKGSMLHLSEHRVHWNEWISIEEGSLTTESLIRLKQLTLQNAYAKKHIGQISRELEISSEVEKTVLKLGAPGPGKKFVIEGSEIRQVSIDPNAGSSPPAAANRSKTTQTTNLPWPPKDADRYRSTFNGRDTTSAYSSVKSRKRARSLHSEADVTPRPKRPRESDLLDRDTPEPDGKEVHLNYG